MVSNHNHMVRQLAEIKLIDRALAGGKAASLGGMLQAGLSVPNGFVITTHQNSTEKTISKSLISEILTAFDDLGTERVAVRSSAIFEDSKKASWAGQLETILNVQRAQLIPAIEQCRHSMDSIHAQAYAHSHKIPKSEQIVAVVIQTMIDSDISGVMFTSNPITGNPSELLIEAVYGLGELLVQGEVTPESITLDKTTGNILITPHHQKEKLVFVNGKNKRIPLAPHYKTQKIMDSSKLRKLQELSEKIATIYDVPQDIEWAFAGDKLYVLQSRPITTLI